MENLVIPLLLLFGHTYFRKDDSIKRVSNSDIPQTDFSSVQSLSRVRLFMTAWTTELPGKLPASSVLCLVTQSCLTFCDPRTFCPPGSSVHGDSPGKNTGVSCHAFLQGIFPTQGSNPGPLHCRRILYHLRHQGSPRILACSLSLLQGIFLTQ